jgi:hypothetical protein
VITAPKNIDDVGGQADFAILGVRVVRGSYCCGLMQLMVYYLRLTHTRLRLSFSRIYCTNRRFNSNMSTKTIAVLDDAELKDGEMYVILVLESLSPISSIVIVQEGSRFRRWKGSFISPGQ